MSKIEVTDEAVERAFQFMRGERFGGHVVDRSWCRHFLDAALNPTPEPGIVVTEEMLSAAHIAMERTFGYDIQTDLSDKGRSVMYRAMRALEPKQPERRCGKDRRQTLDGNPSFSPYPYKGGRRGMKGPRFSFYGRRKDDP